MPAVGNGSRTEHVLIMGGGMGGLATALALKHSGHRVTIVERDPAPPDMDPAAAFEDWKRPGVPQLRHTHIFLARLQSILRQHHPEFLAELEQAGVVRGSMDQLLPGHLADHYVPEEGDQNLLHLWGRRATLEYMLRRYVERLGQVQFVHDASVEKLTIERVGDQLRVTGVELRKASGSELLSADIVVDCLGRRSKSLDWLRAQGVQIRSERIASQCGYYCRHFVQRSSEPEPPRRGTGASLDYLVFGIFFAEKDTFSIAITCPEVEEQLLDRLRRPEGFEEVCKQIPVLQRWLARSEPISRVLGGADLANQWHHFPKRGRSQVLGFFPVGDSYMQTNPIYGRGCSSAFVQAHALADALAAVSDPVERSLRYHRSVWTLLRPYFDFCVSADRVFLARAKHARGEPGSLRDRVMSHLFDAAFMPAIEESSWVAREWLKAQQMSELSSPWRALTMLMYMLWRWPVRALSGARRLLPRVGPLRAEMLRACLPAVPAEPQREDGA
jgi:2-polyprenyl-6-methoxyphenol hydroxylase-like FAD-dependent oxidoreductase